MGQEPLICLLSGACLSQCPAGLRLHRTGVGSWGQSLSGSASLTQAGSYDSGKAWGLLGPIPLASYPHGPSPVHFPHPCLVYSPSWLPLLQTTLGSSAALKGPSPAVSHGSRSLAGVRWGRPRGSMPWEGPEQRRSRRKGKGSTPCAQGNTCGPWLTKGNMSRLQGPLCSGPRA